MPKPLSTYPSADSSISKFLFIVWQYRGYTLLQKKICIIREQEFNAYMSALSDYYSDPLGYTLATLDILWWTVDGIRYNVYARQPGDPSYLEIRYQQQQQMAYFSNGGCCYDIALAGVFPNNPYSISGFTDDLLLGWVGPVPQGYVQVSRWVSKAEADLWVGNGGTTMPSNIGTPDLSGTKFVYVTSPGAPKPGGTGPIRIDFYVPQTALHQTNTQWFRIPQTGVMNNTPIYNVTIYYPK